MSGTGSATAARPTRGVAARGAAGAGRRGRDRARARGWGGSRQDGSRDATALKTRRGRGRNEAGGKQQKEHQPPGPGFGIAHPSVNTPLTTAPAPPGRAPVLSARGSLPPPSPLAPARRPSGLVRRPGARRAKASRATGQRRLRCVLGLPRSARIRAESRPAIRCADSPAGQRAAPAALPTTPSTRQVALAMPLSEAPWTVDEEEPHPCRHQREGCGFRRLTEPRSRYSAGPCRRCAPRPGCSRCRCTPSARCREDTDGFHRA